ncbi:MAG: HD-GYP domain-containing protein, partial [Thermodesulfobacteriota bacterium]
IDQWTFVEARETTPEQVVRKIEEPEVRIVDARRIVDLDRRRKPRPEKPRDDLSLDEELPRARQTYARALDVTREFMADVRAGRQINVEKVREHLEDMIDSVFRNRSSLVALLKLRTYDEYTFTHSLNVTALALSIGRSVNLNREQLNALGLGAMFHDLGKTRVPEAILNKPGRLTDEEFALMKEHPALGIQVLAERHHDLPSSVLQIVRHHHERLDGSGYPDGLSGGQLEPFIIISGICDVYDALSSDRVYHKALVPHEALKVVFNLRGKHFPQVWVDRFVQCIGIYPVGTLVLLSTGDVGVVSEVNQASLVRPVVRLILDRKERPVAGVKYVDLNQMDNEGLDVADVLDPQKMRLDPAQYFPV